MARSLHLQRREANKTVHIFIKPYKTTQIWLETKSNKFFESHLAVDDLSKQQRYLVVRTEQTVSTEWFYFKGNRDYARIHLGLIIEKKGAQFTEISCSVDRMFYSSFIIDVLHAHQLIKIAKKIEYEQPVSYSIYLHPRGWRVIFNTLQYLRKAVYTIINQKLHK